MTAHVQKEADFYSSRDWSYLRAMAFALYGHVCRDCGSTVGPFEVDHIIPLRQWWLGRLVLVNLQILCVGCHHAKHSIRH